MSEWTAGRLLDERVAREVMGWHRVTRYVHGPLMHGGANQEMWEGPGLPLPGGLTPHFRPSESIADAWLVVEKMQGVFSRWLHFTEALQREVSAGLRSGVLIDHDFVWRVVQPSHICRAALESIPSTVQADRDRQKVQRYRALLRQKELTKQLDDLRAVVQWLRRIAPGSALLAQARENLVVLRRQWERAGDATR